jgi:hypothetical protein
LARKAGAVGVVAGVCLAFAPTSASEIATTRMPTFTSAMLRVGGESQRTPPHYVESADCGSFDCSLGKYGRKEPRFDRVSQVRPGEFTARLFIPARMRPTRLAIIAWRETHADASPRGPRRHLDYDLRRWDRPDARRGWKAILDLPLPPDRFLGVRALWSRHGAGFSKYVYQRWSFGFEAAAQQEAGGGRSGGGG